MPFYDRGCLACGWSQVDVFEPITLPSIPACPRCGSTTERVWTSRKSQVIGDECDIWQENGFRDPQHFTHKSALKRALDAKGLEIHACNAGPNDKIVPRWAAMDAQTLANATILVGRAGATSTATETENVPITWTVRDLPTEDL